MHDICSIRYLYHDGSLRECFEPPVGYYMAGCVGEHLEDNHYCSKHFQDLKMGILICYECWVKGAHHTIGIIAEILPSGEKVRVNGV
jgi:hypothetical protein